jgi:membrane associated rhomboid family serine protease
LSDYRFRSGGYRGTGGGRTSGGGGFGGRGSFSLTLPPFYGAVKTLVLINTAVYFLGLLLGILAPVAAQYLEAYGALTPSAVLHGYIYQVVTYGFLHAGLLHLLFNMLMLWMFGAQLEGGWGKKKFYEFYFFSLIGGALVTIAVSYTRMLGVSPLTPTVGASGAIFGLIVAYGVIYAEQEVMLMLPPISLKAKYMAIILVLIEVALALGNARGRGESVAYIAHLGGALFGYIYVRFVPRQGFGFSVSENYYGLRNSYFKWKRRRAAKKFEVYMRKHDRNEYFDQYGNFKAPDDKEKGNGESGRGGWVN